MSNGLEIPVDLSMWPLVGQQNEKNIEIMALVVVVDDDGGGVIVVVVV